MQKVIAVTGIGGNVGQGILRNIKDVFPNILLIGLDITELTPGNYLCDKTYKVPYSYDSEYIQVVKEILDKHNIDLIIPSTDYESYYLSLHKHELKTTLASNSHKTISIYIDKYKSFLHHKKHNIPFAQSWEVKDYDISEKQIIAKPKEGRGSRGILINPEKPKELPEGYMIQKLAIGKEITSAIYVRKSGDIHGIITMERELQNGTTVKSNVIFDYDEKILEIAKKMINSTSLKGSFNIQSIVEATGNIVPFEINCRISGTNSIRHNLGFQDVIYTVEEYLFNKEPTKCSPKKGMATRIMLDVIYPETCPLKNITSSTKHILY